MADFIRIPDTHGVMRRVNTASITQYRPFPDGRGADINTYQNSFMTPATAEAIDRAIEAPGRVAEVQVEA